MLVTNNSMVFADYKDRIDVIYFSEYSYLDVLYYVRDRVHEGYYLLSHPLSGSIKPNETPYKTVMIKGNNKQLDLDSLSIIEGSIETTKKFISNKARPQWTKKILQDFQLIDYYLIQAAIDSMEQS
ncbi:MAG: GrdX family protein [Thermotaleaceae bacterium]